VQPSAPINIATGGQGTGPAPGWPFPTGSSAPSSTGTATIPASGQIVSSNGQPFTVGANVVTPSIVIKGAGRPLINFIAPPPKDDVLYVIVKKNGETLELMPNTPITPREMINIAIFLSVISGFIGTAIAGSPQEMIWSDLIKNLGIERHFNPGQDESTYSSSGTVLHVLLKDPV
jgi:hypothetical protein